MQITRAKATALLNKGEMQLYDDSRHNPIRGFTLKQLQGRVTRARAARDRARDLVRRQKLASRERTGSKRGTSGAANQRSKDKLEILADILKRFEARAREVAKADQAGAGKASAKKAAKTAPRKATKKAAGKKATAKKAATGKAAKKTPKKAARKKAARKVTAKQALRSTRKVLEAKQAEARQPKPWQDIGGHAGQVAGDGFQSGAAAHRAADLHAAESRLQAIHGSVGTRDRINQGKRDSKGGGEG